MEKTPTSPQSNRIYVRCECRKILAHRIKTENGWLLELRYGKRIPTITSAYPLVVNCSGKGCGFVHTISPAAGITDTVRESYDRSIPAQNAGSDDHRAFAAAS